MPYMSLREQRHLLRRYLKQYRLERTPAHRQAVQDTLLHLDPMHPAAPIMRLRYIDCRSWRATELRTYYCHSRAFELETRAIDDLLQVPEVQEAITKWEELAKIEYYNGFNGKKACIEAIDEACTLLVDFARSHSKEDKK